MFIDRQKELGFLNNILTRPRPGPAQMILLCSRRRVGKTALLLHWAESSHVPYTYWAAEKEPANLQRRKLYARLQNMPLRQSPIFDSWAELWDAVANAINLSLFMVNVSQLLLRDLRHEDSNVNVLDLKALYRGHKYVVETIKLLPEKPDPILLSTLFQQISGLGRIHNPHTSLNSP